MKHTLKTLFCLVLLSSCYYCTPEDERQDHFLPSLENLKYGIVHKYYFTRIPKDRNDQPRTEIQYHYFLQNTKGEIITTRYNSAFEPTLARKYVIDGSKVKLLESKAISPNDTLPYVLNENNTFLTFDQDSILYEIGITYKNNYKRDFSQQKRCVGDTIIEGKLAKIIKSEGTRTDTKLDSTQEIFDFKTTEIYIQNFGLWSRIIEETETTYELELIEQLQPERFQELASHSVKRFAYIDFEKTLDKDQPFELCGKQHNIADYYNGGEIDAQFIGGKKPLRRYIEQRLDASKLHNESGYLALRFVVNCEGKAGHFTTDEANLDFNKKEFHPETIQHLYEILASIPNWQSVVIRDEKRDAYTYITFKLKNGKIIDLLP